MSQNLKVMFYLRLQQRMTLIAIDCNGNTDELIRNANDMATVWIDSSWQRDGRAPDDYPVPTIEELDRTLEHFWYLVVLIAKYSPSTSQQQDRLVELIKSKKDLGTLQQAVSSNHSPSEPEQLLQAQSSDGAIWSDLPLMRASLFEAFIRAPPITPTDQWVNLHSFAAKMTMAGVCDLSFYAIWALEDALEVADRIHVMTSKDEVLSVPLSERLEPVLAWMRHCALFLARLCRTGTIPAEQGHDRPDCRWQYPDQPAFIGQLAWEAGIDKVGFSMNRWNFWKGRLETVRDESSAEGSGQTIRSLAIQTLEAMQSEDTPPGES